ncbi:MAG: methylmalonyl-CoA epimerase [Candidatus Methylomirabilia bacterium]
MKVKRVEHVAIAINNLEEVKHIFEKKLGLELQCEEDFPQRHTKIAMYPVGETYLELLQGTSEASDASKWIAQKGQGLFHICLEVGDIEGALTELRAKGVGLLDEQPRVGHGNTRIAFLDPESTANVLIELAEIPRAGSHSERSE